MKDKELEAAVEAAARLHGHLGPFLVIGVRMGKLASEILRDQVPVGRNLRVVVKTPSLLPFTCTIDGIQSTTRCTIGNQKLSVEKSRQEISAIFSVEDSKETKTITVEPNLVNDLIRRMHEGSTNKELAMLTAAIPDNQLFIVKDTAPT